MTGFIYKEFKQNQAFIFLMTIIAVVVIFAPLPMEMSMEKMSLQEAFAGLTGDGNTIRLFMLILGYVGAGALQGLTLRGNDRKLWAIFTASTPDGIDGFIRIKYEMIFAMIVLMAVSCWFFDQLLGAMVFDITGKVLPTLSSMYMALSFIQIFLRAIEIPFIVRFGMKRGSVIKTIILIIITIILSFLVLLNPGGVVEKAVSIALNIYDTSISGTDILLLVLWSSPLFALGLYYLSYKISCKLYMKGVEQYDK